MERATAAKRKFPIDKVWGSATSLRLIDAESRLFDERPLLLEGAECKLPAKRKS